MSASAAIGPERYPSAVWQRFCAPAYAGAPEDAVSACARDAAHQLEIGLHADAGGVRFSAVGCPTTIAVADYCAEAWSAAGEPPSTQAIVDALEIAEDRRHCVRLCEDAVCALKARMAESPPRDVHRNRQAS